MFRIIKAVRPDYIIGENVPGLLSIEGGMVFEQVCLDLESEGYEVQAFVLPACATGAPHRRDRVWIVAYSNEVRRTAGFRSVSGTNGEISERNENAEFGNTNSGATTNTEEINAIGICGIKDREWEVCENFGHNWNGIRSEIEGCGEFIESGVVAYSNISRDEKQSEEKGIKERVQREYREERCSGLPYGTIGNDGVTSDNYEKGLEGGAKVGNAKRIGAESHEQHERLSNNYWHNWPSISPFHSGHDGLSPELVRHIRTSLAEAGETPENIEAYIRKEANWLRKQAIMAAGNAVVPTVVLQVMKAIQNHYENTND